MKKIIYIFSLLALMAFAAPVQAGNYQVDDNAIETLFSGANEITADAFAQNMNADLQEMGISLGNQATFAPKGDSKLVAIILCALFGPIGIHRLYMGAPFKVAVFYCCWGFIGVNGLLTFGDMVVLIVNGTEAFAGNDKVWAWLD